MWSNLNDGTHTCTLYWSTKSTSSRQEVCRARREIFDGWRRWEGGAEKPVGGQGEAQKAARELCTAVIPASPVMSVDGWGSFPPH